MHTDFIVFHYPHIRFPAEPVHNDANEFFRQKQGNLFFIAAKHSERAFGILRRIHVKEILSLALFLFHLRVLHFVHAVVLYAVRFRIICRQVIIFIIPDKRQRAHHVGLAVPAGLQGLCGRPLQIGKGNLSVRVDCRINGIHAVINLFILRFDTSQYLHLSVKLACLIGACLFLQFMYQLS